MNFGHAGVWSVGCRSVLLEVSNWEILIGVRIIKEMPGSVASGTHCVFQRAVYSVNASFSAAFTVQE